MVRIGGAVDSIVRICTGEVWVRSTATLHLVELRAKPLAGPFDSHFQRGDAHARELGHLLVSHLYDVFQEKCFAMILLQTHQRSLKLLSPRRPLRGVIFRRIEERDLVAHKRLFTTPSTRTSSATTIGEYAKQPRAEFLRFIASR
jgi:hypothetical protein